MSVVAMTLTEWQQNGDRSIVNTIARQWGYDPDRLRGSQRHQEFVEGRRIVADELRVMGWSYPRIGRALGGRDHSSIWWLLRGGRHKVKRTPEPTP